MELAIDVSSAEAVYEQIVRQVQQGVLCGALPPGAPLPSIRQFADDLDLNPNTVAKAYKILETRRVIQTAGRKGTFIRHDAASHIDSGNHEDALALAGQLVRALADKGLSREQIETAFATAAQSVFDDREKTA